MFEEIRLLLVVDAICKSGSALLKCFGGHGPLPEQRPTIAELESMNYCSISKAAF